MKEKMRGSEGQGTMREKRKGGLEEDEEGLLE